MTIDGAPAVPVPEVQQTGGEARLLRDGWVSEFEAFQWAAEARNACGTSPAVLASARSGRSAAVSRRSTGGGPGCGSGSGSGDSSKAMDDLRAEIKLLHWHKLANEAALKAALLKTKKIKMQGGGNARPVPATTTLAMPIEERAAWMQQIIEEEQSKPLRVTKDFVSKYEAREKENEGRLDSEVAGHIRSLRNLRKQIEKREAMKDRRAKYRAAQKQLEGQKERLLLGNVQSRDKESSAAQSGRRLMHGQPGNGEGTAGGAAGGPGKGSQQTIGALGTVLGSLDKLVELEKRITYLEKSNVYDDFRATKPGGAESSTDRHVSRSGGSRRGSSGPRVVTSGASASSRISRCGRTGGRATRNRLSFSKQKTEATVETPSQVYYAVRVSNRRAGSTSIDSTSRRGRPVDTGRTDGVLRPRAGVATTRGAASTFLTQLPDVHRRAQGTGGRAVGGASRGRGAIAAGFRSAVSEKKHLEANRKIAGARAEAVRIARQDRIIREWMQRKKASAATANCQRKSSVLSRGAGSFSVVRRRAARVVAGSAGEATSFQANIHLQEFRDIRAEYAKRTEKLRRDLSHRRRGSGSAASMAGTRTLSIARRRASSSATATASTIQVRPARMSRVRPGMGRERGPWAASVAGASLRRGIAATTARRPLAQRGRERRGLTVGGTGLRAARARRKQGPSAGAAGANGSGGGVGGTGDISGSRRTDGPPWLQRARGARPLVGVLGRMLSGRSTAGRGCW